MVLFLLTHSHTWGPAQYNSFSANPLPTSTIHSSAAQLCLAQQGTIHEVPWGTGKVLE